jgi:hypothetical protein
MPKLVLFAACRNAVIDQEDNTVTLVCILNGLTVPGGIPDGRSTAIDWGAVSVWAPDPSDLNDEIFELRVQVRLPDDSLHGEAIAPFTMTQDRFQSVIKGARLPLWQSGDINFVLCMRSITRETDWKQYGEFPTIVTHGPPRQTHEDTNEETENSDPSI